MSLFKDVINLWKADDLLSQAWDDSHEMLNLSHEIFQQALIYLKNGENIDKLKTLKKGIERSMSSRGMSGERC